MVGSDWSMDSIASSWTVHSDGRRAIDVYRSFEDIPASPRVKSRRASLDIDNEFFGSGLAMSVLKDSYKGFDSTGNISPQIRKLRKNFSFHDSLQDFKTAVCFNDEEKIGDDNVQGDEKKEEGHELEFRSPMYRSISVAQSSDDLGDREQKQSPRQRKIGLPLHRNLSFEGLKKPEVNLRKEILKQTLPDFKSCGDLLFRYNTRHDSADDDMKAVPLGVTLLKDSYQGIEYSSANISANIRKLKKNFSFVSLSEARDGEPFVISDVDRRKSDAKYENNSTNTSNVVGISRNCDCRICSEEDREDRRSIWRKIFCKLFIKTVSINHERKAYWDENNNLDEGEMYKCVMHTLKLLFGLWLRHFDHN